MNTKDRPSQNPELRLVNGLRSAAAQNDPTHADQGDDYEFSRLVLPEPIPFELPPARLERTWQRLARSASARHMSALGYRRFAGPAAALAACAATFVVGIWVGAEKGAPHSAQVVSAEPIAPGRGSGGQLSAVAGRAEDRDAPLLADNQGGEVAQPQSVVRPPNDDAEKLQADRLTPRPSVNLGRGAAVSPSSSLVTPVTTQALPAVPTSTERSPAWQQLANNGDYEAALVEIGQAGGFERILEAASAEQLMLLSDVARGTGQQQRALAALRRIVSEHRADPVAPLAALNMGTLLDKMGDGAGATEAFAIYRALSPQGDFAEDALVRQIRSAMSAGQQDLARRLVHQYEVDFPEGRRADEVARWAEQIPTPAGETDAGATHRAAHEE